MLVCLFAPAMGQRDSIYAITKAKPDALARSIVWAPTSQHAWFYAGKRLGRSKRKPLRLLGERFMSQSMVYDPKNYRHWRKLGELRFKQGDRDGQIGAAAADDHQVSRYGQLRGENGS